MIIEVVAYIDVNIEDIIATYNIKKSWSKIKIKDVVNDYISGFDDCDYYPLLGKVDDIVEEVKKYLKKRG